VAVRVKLANVARLEPSVLGQRALGLLLVVKVARGHTATADVDLTLRRAVLREVSGIGEVHEFDFYRSRNLTQGVRVPRHWVIQSTHGGGLGQPITTDHGSNGHRQEALGILGDGATTVHYDAKVATGSLLEFLENDSIKDRSTDARTREAIVKQEVLGCQCTPEHALDDEAVFVQVVQDALLHRLPDGRNTNQDSGLELTNVTFAVAHGAIGQSPRVTVAHAATPKQTQVLEHELQDVRLGQVCEQRVLGANVLADDFVDTGGRGNHVGLGQRDTLGRAGRARGVHDAAEVLRLGRHWVHRVLLAALAQILNAQRRDVREVGLELVQVRLLHLIIGIVDNEFDRGHVAQDVDQGLDQTRIEEDGSACGLLEGVLQAILAEGIIGSDDGDGLRCSAV